MVAVVRSEQSLAELRDLGPNITCRIADVCDIVAVEHALDGVDRIVHAAAKVSFNPRDARAMYDINVLGTRNVVDVALARGVKRFVHISSIAALGRQKTRNM
ncbi:MAG: NAD-dependent epimerase/dehydratase family protein [Bacteroidia bacterium]|nr:NAD-dependent epimerase/dehydratase family protein [Bacteroidia bacterium]